MLSVEEMFMDIAQKTQVKDDTGWIEATGIKGSEVMYRRKKWVGICESGKCNKRHPCHYRNDSVYTTNRIPARNNENADNRIRFGRGNCQSHRNDPRWQECMRVHQ